MYANPFARIVGWLVSDWRPGWLLNAQLRVERAFIADLVGQPERPLTVRVILFGAPATDAPPTVRTSGTERRRRS